MNVNDHFHINNVATVARCMDIDSLLSWIESCPMIHTQTKQIEIMIRPHGQGGQVRSPTHNVTLT